MYGTVPLSPEDLGHSHLHSHKKKRVGKACDSCRIKKTKCDGKKPCNKCIQDNKICVFTEKKKVRDKSYPSGYVELLETRLDLLTKLFEKIVQISAPHIPFLNEMVMSENESVNLNEVADSEDVLVPINKVINYLISEQGLLKNLPLEWENGAMIAANFNPNTIELDSKKFASRKNDPIERKESVTVKKEDEDLQSFDEFKDEFDDLDNNKFNLLMNNYSSRNYSSGGFVLANSAALNDGLSNELSDFESDSNSNYSQAHPPLVLPIISSDSRLSLQPLSPGTEKFTTPSLFGHTEADYFQRSSSVNSISKLEHPISRSPSTVIDSKDHPELVRRSSSILSRPRSPSHQKLKNIGHVHKPLYGSPHHNHGNVNLNGSVALSHSRKSSLLGDLINDVNPHNILLDNDTLPSDSVKMPDFGGDDNILDGL